jgi:hypothetical protein
MLNVTYIELGSLKHIATYTMTQTTGCYKINPVCE